MLVNYAHGVLVSATHNKLTDVGELIKIEKECENEDFCDQLRKKFRVSGSDEELTREQLKDVIGGEIAHLRRVVTRKKPSFVL